MAREIHIPYGVVGSTDLYLRFRNASGQYRRGDTGAYETYNAADIALYGADAASGTPYHVATEDGSTGDYFSDLPDATARGYSVYLQAGAAPSADGAVDVEIASGSIGLDATAAAQAQSAAAAAIEAANLSQLDEMSVQNIIQSELSAYDVSNLDVSDVQAAAEAAITAAAIPAGVVSALGNGSALTEAGGTGDHLTALATAAQAAAIAAKTDTIPADPATVTKQDAILAAVDAIEPGSGATAQEVWEYASRTLTMSPAAVQALLVESTLTIRRGDSVTVDIPLSQDPSTATAVVFTVKRHPVGDLDTAAIIQVTEADGLTRLNGLAADDAALGTLTTSGTTATLTIHGEATADLTVKTGLYWDVQIIDADGDPVTIAEGRLNVTADVTRATE